MEVTTHEQDTAHSPKLLLCITKANWGGAQRYVYELALAAKEAGFAVVVAYGSPGALAERLRDAGVRGVAIPNLARDVSVGADWAAYRALSEIIAAERPDILHLNSSKIGALGALAGRLHRVPKIIFTAHGWAFNEDRSALAKAVLYLIYWFTAILSTNVIAVSHATKRQVRHFPFVQKKIVVIHNGVTIDHPLSTEQALEFFRSHRSELRTRMEQRPTIIGTIAELHPIKGLTYLVQAAKLLSERGEDHIVLIMGEGQDRAHLEKEISLNGLRDRVFLLGHVPNASSYLEGFDIFTLPSLSEALALVVLEAGLASRPVVASHVGGIPEVVPSDEFGILVPPKDSAALAEALVTLIHDEGLRHRLGQQLHDRVATEFSAQHMTKETLSQYR